MQEQGILDLLNQLPNFAGFILLALFLYKALMQSMENNRYLADKLMNCYKAEIDDLQKGHDK